MSKKNVLAVIGGSGLYEIEGLTNVSELRVDTPFGAPSDALMKGDLGDTTLLFLPRHGRGHRIAPHAINYRANVCALKMSGATHLVSVSAVGSMKEAIAPGDLVVVDQFIDLTKRRDSSFFDAGLVGHVGFGDPVCDKMAAALAMAADAAVAAEPGEGDPTKRDPKKHGAKKSAVHRGGTYVCIEGPQFSSRAESLVYRSWGVSVIGMTAMPEAKLAREAELPYATLALSTDYDCWHSSEEDVSVEVVVATLKNNIGLAKRALAGLAATLPDPATSRATGALKNAVMTAPEAVSAEARKKLSWLVGSTI